MVHGDYENVIFCLSIKIFHQYIFHLTSFSLWAAIFLLPWLPKLCSATLMFFSSRLWERFVFFAANELFLFLKKNIVSEYWLFCGRFIAFTLDLWDLCLLSFIGKQWQFAGRTILRERLIPSSRAHKPDMQRDTRFSIDMINIHECYREFFIEIQERLTTVRFSLPHAC